VQVNEGDEWTHPAPDYKGVVVLDNHASKEALRRFNDANSNLDGKRCLIALLNGKFKEGVDLKHVFYAWILGFVRTQAELVQIVARANRNCGRKGTRWPWLLRVFLYTPTLPQSDLRPLQLFNLLNPDASDIERAKEAMNLLLQEAAYDKLLLQSVNARSRKYMELLKLFPPK
jgi:hypothetical protein